MILAGFRLNSDEKLTLSCYMFSALFNRKSGCWCLCVHMQKQEVGNSAVTTPEDNSNRVAVSWERVGVPDQVRVSLLDSTGTSLC